MGEAKQRRDARGIADERTDIDREAAHQKELRRIEYQASDAAVMRRRACAGVDEAGYVYRVRVSK